MIVGCPRCQLRYDVTGRPPGTRARCRCGQLFTLPRPSKEAATLGCPRCGAAASPEASRCNYCEATLAKARCPRCFGLLFSGVRFCNHCGENVDVPARALHGDDSTERQCPRCVREAPGKRAMVSNLVGDTLIDQCGHCGGLWVDQTAFERLVDEKDKNRTALSAVGTWASGESIKRPPPQDVAYLPCPDCEGLMTRVNYAKRSGIIIDICRAHGVWFDRDELPSIVDFVQKGGLEEARRRELERLKQEAREARSNARYAELESKRAGANPSRSVPAAKLFFSDHRMLGRRGGGLAGLVRVIGSLLS